MGHLDCQHLTDGVCALTGCPAPPSLCEHCREDRTGLFRAKLEAVHARRMLRQRLAAAGERFTCHRYGGIQVDGEFCLACRRNPALKQRLAGNRSSALRERNPCAHRAGEIGIEEVVCCGGKTKEVSVYACAKGHKAHTYTCRTCPDYEPSSREKGRPAVACVDWPDLWQIHQGQTILVLACGPSVALPGEAPSPDTVDPHTVERDVVLSTNWAWKWFAGICEYQLCYDVTPCQGWRPARLRLLTVRRPQRTMNVLERTQEIGVRMAVGARQRDIVAQFLLETTLLSGVSGLLGIAVGILTIPLATILNQGTPVLDPRSIPLSFVVALLTGMVFGLYPAIRASRFDPVEALRYE